MNKSQVIAYIETHLKDGTITKHDLNVLLAPRANNQRNLINVLYAIGAIIALIGVIILIGENWNEIGFVGRVGVTLGISLIAYCTGLLFKDPEQAILAQVMFTISAFLAPIGTYVLFDEAQVRYTHAIQIGIACALALIYGVALRISRRAILVLITIGCASWAYYALLLNIFGNGYYSDIDFLKWGTMILGASYIAIAIGYRATTGNHPMIRTTLYAAGTLAILGAGISMGGLFDLIFILLIFAAFYASVYVKSNAILILASIFLVAHIIKLTSKYFIDSIGWPIALIAIGFLVIGIGYATFYVSKRYIQDK
jgi:uncharacterized membrane protein